MDKPHDKRGQIMAAAEGLFTSRRFHELTLDDVARAAHVGKGTIYLYFADKEDLFFQTATSGFDELCDLLRRGVSADASFEEQLSEACERMVHFFRHRHQLFRMMLTEEGRYAAAPAPSSAEAATAEPGADEAAGGPAPLRASEPAAEDETGARPAGVEGTPPKPSLRERWCQKRKGLLAAVAEVLRRGAREGRIRGDVPPEVLAHFLLGMLRTYTRDLAAQGPDLATVLDLFRRGAAAEAGGRGETDPSVPPASGDAVAAAPAVRRALRA